MSVHYKFKSALEYDTVTFDGLHISVKDLKNAIVQQKRIGKNTDFDLQVTNAQTKETYDDINALIPKNTSLLIARIPTSSTAKNKQWEGYGGDATPPTKPDEGGPIAKAVDLSSLDAPEGDKIKAMISQSTQDYDPSNYMKIRGANQVGQVPPNYRCYKCHQNGHWIKDCPLGKGPDPVEIKKSTGIPLSFMVPVDGPQVPGAMMTPNGSYAVPALDHQTYSKAKSAHSEAAFSQNKAGSQPSHDFKPEIPEDLLCSICSDLLIDAVMIPCCGNSFCDECIRSILLESEEHECPDCHEKDISPVTLIPNRFLRNSVANFRNTTGYIKKPTHQFAESASKTDDSTETSKFEEKTVISEADSTEPKAATPECEPKSDELPPGVESPPEMRPAPPKPADMASESPYNADRNRPGTPTVDEPGGNAPNYVAPPVSAAQPNRALYGAAPGHIAAPSAASYHQPPSQSFAPAPNFRLPPPNVGYIAPNYQVAPPRGFAPVVAPPPVHGGGYGPSYGGSGSRREGYTGGDGLERRARGRTPTGVIDDPLAAFNRMLREKDERERRAKRVAARRSYSRSRSRSRSWSRSPRRMRSRSRGRRSRTRSFTMSRSRSRSFSGSPFRDFSPRHSPPLRRGRKPSRYRSPICSPPPRRRGGHPPDHYRSERHRNRERDFERAFSRERDRERDPIGRRDEREHHRRDYGPPYYDNFERKRNDSAWNGPPPAGRQGPPLQPPPPSQPVPAGGDYYHYAGPPGGYPQNNRYVGPPTRDFHPPPHYVMPKPDSMHHTMLPPSQQVRRFDDIAPPGVEEPPIPGVEPPPQRFAYQPPPQISPSAPTKARFSPPPSNKSPQTTAPSAAPPTTKESKSRDWDSPERHPINNNKKRKTRDDSDAEERTNRKSNKEKKRKKKDKDGERKKRKEKREKHHRSRDEKDEQRKSKQKGDEKAKTPEMEAPKEEPTKEAVPVEASEITEEKIVDKVEIEAVAPPLLDKEADEENVLEIHANDLKTELDDPNMALLPEKSKWEQEEEGAADSSPVEPKNKDASKVTNEVLKRAENAIFAKAINAIRPIEIKKISTDRAKLYSDEMQPALGEAAEEEGKGERAEAPRVSVKERLGVKVDEERIVRVNKSASLSPFSRRNSEATTSRNYEKSERKVVVEVRRRRERSRGGRRHRSRSRGKYRVKTEAERVTERERRERRRLKERVASRRRGEERAKSEKRKRSKSNESERKRRKEKRKVVKKEEEEKVAAVVVEEEEKVKEKEKAAAVVEKQRKPTIDEASFEPDYDLESESEKEEKKAGKKASSSSESSETSSEEEDKKERKGGKGVKHRKKRSKKETSSSSSESETESSDDEKKRKKHKKKQKKRKKSRHK